MKMEVSLKTLANRRNILLGTAGAAAFASMGQLSGCSSTTVIPAVVDVINKIIAGTCQIVPVLATVIDVIISVFPGAAGVATITDALAQQIASYICNLFKTAGLQDGKHPGKALHASLKEGATPVPLHCYMIVNNQLAYV
jgi:hypothetical protein